MKKLLVLPTWLIAKAANPFLSEDHPLKRRKLTLKYWADNSTDLNLNMSLVFWIMILSVLVSSIRLFI